MDQHELEATSHGFESGWIHADYVEAYGLMRTPDVPDRFQDVASYWLAGFGEGFYAYTDYEAQYME
jgi:hypothetical protein